MKFVDEVLIYVQAGKGGDGCLSFLRAKFIPKGGPNGGDGGRGGSVHIKSSSQLNTLSDYRFKRRFKAQNGEGGKGKLMTGKAGDDLDLLVPAGTRIYNANTNELIADLVDHDDKSCVAKGGHYGLGNVRFKSSTNQTPRRITKGMPGESIELRLELRVLADVGLLGLPNAGKSTLIRVISNARPKVADYPFTTLYPNLGVVNVSAGDGFVVADIPGLIAGASKGAGMGIRFLKHLQRTRLLLHLVDVSFNSIEDIIKEIKDITQELINFDSDLASKPRWLVLNKIDLLPLENTQKLFDQLIKELKWKEKAFMISAIKLSYSNQIHI